MVASAALFTDLCQFPFLMNDEYRLPAGIDSAHASWQSAVIFAVCSSAAFWLKSSRLEETAFVTASSLTSA